MIIGIDRQPTKCLKSFLKTINVLFATEIAFCDDAVILFNAVGSPQLRTIHFCMRKNVTDLTTLEQASD